MKLIRLLAAAIFTALLLTTPALAVDYSAAFGQDEAAQALPGDAAGILDGWDGSDGAESGLERLLDAAKKRLSGAVNDVLAPVCAVLAVTLLCSAAGTMEQPGGMSYANLAGCLAISALCAGDMSSLVSLSGRTMTELSDFSRALLPTLCAAASAAGAVSSAPAKYAAAALFLDVLTGLAQRLIFPLVCTYIAAVTANSALGGGQLKGVVRLLRSICRIVLTAFVTAFTLYLSVTGIIAASTDQLATKAAKTALSAALPVVGGIISDAAGSVVAGAGVVRGAVGVFGLVAVLAVCLTPFLKLGVRYLLLKAASAVCTAASGGRMAELISGLADACAMLLGTVGAQAVFLYISIISMVKAVTG